MLLGFTPDDERLVSGSLDGYVKAWSVRAGREIWTGRAAEEMSLLGFSRDSRFVSVQDEIFLAASGTRAMPPPGCKIGDPLLISPDGRVVATNRAPNPIGLFSGVSSTIVLLGWATQTTAGLSGFHGGPPVAFSEDGKLLAGRAAVWDVKTGARRYVAQDASIQGLSPNGERVLVQTDDGIEMCDVRTGKILHGVRPDGEVESVAMSRDGRWVAVGSHDGRIELCDLASGGRKRVLMGHHRQVNALAFNRAGTLLASGSGDNREAVLGWRGRDDSVRLWALR